jgi:hypothetical protein
VKLERSKEQLEGDIPIELPKDEPEAERFFNVREVMPGLHTWTNPGNGFTVTRVHYLADPAKRSAEWKKEARRGVTWSEWMREYEIVSSSFEGTPVFGDDFSRAYHVSKEPLVWSERHPVIRGWDFGLGAGGMACVFAQLLAHGRLFVYREITASDTDLEHFAPEVARLSSDWFPNCVKWFDIIDPTGFNRSQLNKKRSCAVVLRENKMEPIPGIASQVVRRSAVSKFLSSNIRGLPKFVIDPDGCPMLVAGFEGGYHYAKQKDGQNKEEPEKNEYSHPQDGLQMICCKVNTLELSKPTLHAFGQASYGFGKTTPVGEPARRYA